MKKLTILGARAPARSSGRVAAICALLFLASAPLSAATEAKVARTCVKATQTERGRMQDVSVAESSGFESADDYALNLVKIFRLSLKRSQSVPRQEGFVIVDVLEDGSFGSTLFDNKGRLVRACNDPMPLENGFGTADKP